LATLPVLTDRPAPDVVAKAVPDIDLLTGIASASRNSTRPAEIPRRAASLKMPREPEQIANVLWRRTCDQKRPVIDPLIAPVVTSCATREDN
jgi:hypothetical protein